eukprot:TRINITY_DN2227_c0_g1_i1.p1 TRINITY_DN2227_c0_g1~~TRINITY_DN2227_c0_g1_i1.p1  ORF type:complete len:616 (+),score=177.27 TRINITY_DN2227_c0_g1_i1:137-1984(+)
MEALEESVLRKKRAKEEEQGGSAKRKKVLKFEQLYLEHLPNAEFYERSYMHRDVVTHIAVAKTDYIITASVDGHVKFWKKQPEGIEFVKHFRAHVGPVVGLAVTSDGTTLCTISSDRSVKVYDVLNFDMINMFKLPYVPYACEFVSVKGSGRTVLACSSKTSPTIYLYDANGDSKPLHEINLHKSPVKIIKYNEVFGNAISIDDKGMVEYWSAATRAFPDNLQFQFKTDTDLYEFLKCKTTPTSLSFSKDGTFFAIMGQDRFVRVFRYLTGKLYRKYDETLATAGKIQKEEDSPYKLDTMEYGRRMTVEKELEAAYQSSFHETSQEDASVIAACNVIFDESGNFIFYSTMLGIKMVNLVSNKVVRILGKGESGSRFLNLALYQGKSLGSVVTENYQSNSKYDPTLFCTSFKKQRFYMFTKREPIEADAQTGAGRDVYNERPTKEELSLASKPSRRVAKSATIHTSRGDIHIKLFGEECPKTVENFTVHSKNGYYNNCTFHRVIKNFMIQTGDPGGDGTGGVSIWGGEFEDEFSRDLRHDRPFTVSMANAGPGTNGSQFFITTVACPSLDGKHTVFGRATKGTDVVSDIEKVKTDKGDKPLEDIKIISITVNFTDD